MKIWATLFGTLVIAVLAVIGVLWNSGPHASAGTKSEWAMLKKATFDKIFEKHNQTYNSTPVPAAILDAPIDVNPHLAPPHIFWPPGTPGKADVQAPEWGLPGQYNITNFLLAPAGPIPEILAGSLGSSPSQGIFVFVKNGVGRVYQLPVNSGPSTFTALKNGRLTFSTTSGIKGTVSITTGAVTILP